MTVQFAARAFPGRPATSHSLAVTADLSFIPEPSEGGRGKELKSVHSGKGRGWSEGASLTSETWPHTDTLANRFVELIASWQEVWAQGQELNEMAFLGEAWGLR